MSKTMLCVLLMLFSGGSMARAESVKKADLAGTWYPGDEKRLSGMLNGYIVAAGPRAVNGHIAGLISPHAGYTFSGRAAAYAFKAIKDHAYTTVVIIGFSHRQYYDGIAVYADGIFRTPLGDAIIDSALAHQLIDPVRHIASYPPLFTQENSVEMIIPFVQSVLPRAKIIPIAFGAQSFEACEALAGKLAALVKDRSDLLIIASSDMSHFHPYDEANLIDQRTITLVEGLRARELFDATQSGLCELCGAAPVTTLLLTMKLLGADHVAILTHENSGDVTGERDRVVGYFSAVFYKEAASRQRPVAKSEAGRKKEARMLNEEERKRLLAIARTTMEGYVKTGKVSPVTETDPALTAEKGAFVTLRYRGELRGCIGNIIGRGPLYQTVRDMAVESATADPRFTPVTPAELKDIRIEISVLSVPERERDPGKIVMGIHGVIVKRGFKSGVFLPQVATETGWDRDEFLSTLCSQKAGLPRDAWKDPATELYTFTAEVFGEKP